MIILFLTYIDRSGSTFLVNTLSKNLDILICPEAEILSLLFLSKPNKKFDFSSEYLHSIFETDIKLKHWRMDVSEVEQICRSKTNFEGFMNTLILYQKRENPNAKLLIYKAQEIVYYYHKIKDNNIHQSRFLALVRDVRGIYASQTKSYHLGKSKPMSTNPFALAKKWNYFIDKCNKYRLDGNFFIINFENLIKNYEHVINELFKNLKLGSSINLLGDPAFEKVMAEDQKTLHPNISEDPQIDKISSWHKNLQGREIKILELICRKRMINKGYKITEPSVNKIEFFVFRITLLIKYYLSLPLCKAKNQLFNLAVNRGLKRLIISTRI